MQAVSNTQDEPCSRFASFISNTFVCNFHLLNNSWYRVARLEHMTFQSQVMPRQAFQLHMNGSITASSAHSTLKHWWLLMWTQIPTSSTDCCVTKITRKKAHHNKEVRVYRLHVLFLFIICLYKNRLKHNFSSLWSPYQDKTASTLNICYLIKINKIRIKPKDQSRKNCHF